MTQYEEKQRLFDRYREGIAGFGAMYRKDDIPERKYKNIKRKFKRDPGEKGILGFYDTSLICNGTEGFIFAENYICYKIILDVPKMIYYKNIRKIGVKGSSLQDDANLLYLQMKDGSIEYFQCGYLNKESLEEYIKGMRTIEFNENETGTEVESIVENDEDNYSVYSEMLEELIGLEEVKDQVKKITAFAKLKKDMDERGMDTEPISLNMAFVGNPGTAKTTVARIMAGLLHETGIISSNEIIEVGRADLVAQYEGQTADRVKKIFKKAKGKVLFIDEAYSLLEDNICSFGDEAINTIVQEMENNREDTVVIFAGYPDRMEEFISRNPGLRSRIPFKLRFKDYTSEEMVKITEAEVTKRGFTLSLNSKDRLKDICRQATGDPKLGNGRFCRNIVEKALLSYASRVYGNGCQNTLRDFELSDEDFPENIENDKSGAIYGFV